MAKRKKQIKKPSIAAILGMILLGLVAVGVVANVIKDNVKEEEDPIVEELPGDEEPGGDETEVLSLTIKNTGDSSLCEDIIIQYEEGMTWAEWIDSKYYNNSLCIKAVNYGAPDSPAYYKCLAVKNGDQSEQVFTRTGSRILVDNYIEDLGLNFYIGEE